MAIATRQEKGSALTHAEVDNNFKELEIGTIGLNQTWEDVTASRSLGVTYTNTTGKPIHVSVSTIHSAGSTYSSLSLKVNGNTVSVFSETDGSNTRLYSLSTIVPHNSTYEAVTGGALTVTLSNWSELR